MNEVTSSEERVRVSDGTPYRYPFSLRLVK
jgi:uncharacterized Tic20 family protein